MNSIRFNIILGLFSLLGFLFTDLSYFTSIPLYLLAVLALFLYVGEYWAFLYKLKIARIRELHKISKGNPSLRIGMGTEPGCMMFYAYLIRFVFRIALGMIVLTSFGGKLNDELNNVQVVFMIAIVLFELFNLMYSLYEVHIFKINGEDPDTEKEIEAYWEGEKKWRSKNYPLLNQAKTATKELFANIILLIMAFVITQILWTPMNNDFREFIVRTAKNHESVAFACISVPISCFLLCFFFLMPVRLAFWVEERMKADEKPELLHYRLSLLFAGLSVCAPTLIQLFVSFVWK